MHDVFGRQLSTQQLLMFPIGFLLFGCSFAVMCSLVGPRRLPEFYWFLGGFGVTAPIMLLLIRSHFQTATRQRRATAVAIFELSPSVDDGLLELSELILHSFGWSPTQKIVRTDALKLSAGQLTEWIEARFCAESASVKVRPTQLSQLRHCLVSQSTPECSSFPVAMPLKQVQFRGGLRKSWNLLQQKFGETVPPLELTYFATTVITWLAITVVIVSLGLSAEYLEKKSGVYGPSGGVGTLLMGKALGYLVTIPLVICTAVMMTIIVGPYLKTFPPKCRTVGELAGHIETSKTYEVWNRQNLWPEIRDIIARVHGVPVEAVKPDTPIIRKKQK